MPKVQVLKGVRIAEFCMAIAGPRIAKTLAEFGAVVVKVESLKKIDVLRLVGPFAQSIRGVNRSSFFQYNNDKYDIIIELPQGIEVAKKLVSWADVVIENFTAGTMEKLGLGYEDVRKIKNDIIMVGVSGQGQQGPHAGQKGFGTQFASLAGFSHFFSHPGMVPIAMPNAYTDFIAPWYAVIAIMAALIRRHRTGEGSYIDLSQFESGVTFLSPAILDYAANQRVQNAIGNRCTYAAPHGAYRCIGDDRWCVIAVFSDKDWNNFCKAIGEPSWTKDAKFATLLGRKENEGELDKLVEQWAISHTPEEVTEVLQAVGIAAGVVKNGKDLFEDPQLEHRHFLWRLEHPEMGITSYEDSSFRLSKTPSEIRRPAPLLGEHTEYICKQLLGISDEEFDKLLADDIISLRPQPSIRALG